MNAWRQGRDRDGWKMSKSSFAAFLDATRRGGKWFEPTSGRSDTAPVKVKSVKDLYLHLMALVELFESDEPTLRLIRGSIIYQVVYVFGDASGEGFGSTYIEPTTGAVHFRFGIWGVEGKDTSSNFRELRNLVESLEEMGRVGSLAGREVLIFTDNMVSESVAANGSSSSPELYNLIVRVYKLEMKFRCRIQFIHVAGTRMIEQGADGLSRGDMYEGVMRGESMLDFIPLHQSAIERHPPLLDWISSWSSKMGNEVEHLSPEGWFERGHDIAGGRDNSDGIWMPRYSTGTYVWAPPPGCARIVVEELRQARQKRQASTHVFVCPRLMSPEWMRHLYKSADLILKIPAGKLGGDHVWPASMHETLIIAIYFPFLRRCPWELKKTGLMVGLARKLCRLCKTDITAAGALLSEFCVFSRRLDFMPLRELRNVLQGQSAFAVPSE